MNRLSRGLMLISGFLISVMPVPSQAAQPETPAPATTDSKPGPATAATKDKQEPTQPMIQDNMDVSLEYTLTVDGKEVDSTSGREPFHYVHGKGQIVPGLERQLAGLHIGDQKEVVVKPSEGYGEVDPSAVVEMPKSNLPKDVIPLPGMVLRGKTPEGQNFQARIKEVKEERVMLDLNHPLAGKTLVFKVKITGIAPASGG